MSAVRSDILFTQWAMRFRVGVSGSHCINLTRVYSQIPFYAAFIVGFYSFISDLKACNVYGSQLSYAVHPKTGRRKWCSDLSENSWCHSAKESQNKYHLKVTTLLCHTIQKSFHSAIVWDLIPTGKCWIHGGNNYIFTVITLSVTVSAIWNVFTSKPFSKYS